MEVARSRCTQLSGIIASRMADSGGDPWSAAALETLGSDSLKRITALYASYERAGRAGEIPFDKRPPGKRAPAAHARTGMHPDTHAPALPRRCTALSNVPSTALSRSNVLVSLPRKLTYSRMTAPTPSPCRQPRG